ncbi:ROK family glucokinase [Brachybacterium sp. EF45031]|uniref:ROK family glucokinase n=1 Tax=Brachybacterium sillae TaxID=2810536 RepID=UPI00217D4964|nr:ROK family glucokinase [Brachybacterium sillae]MCS6710489.1 ROK family glucokinase [Brachybacterium sillae]
MLAIGVDIGGTKIAAGLVDEDGRLLARAQRTTPATDPELIEAAVADAVTELRQGRVVGAIGVGAAGFVDARRRTVVFAANLAWRHRPLADELEALTGLPVVVENDANAAGWAEFRFGAAREADHMLMLTVGTGLGGAVVHDGRLLRGSGGFAAEVAHVTAVPDGQWCGCGNRGCLEQYTSGRALVKAARRRLRAGDPTLEALRSEAGGDPSGVDGPLVTRLAQQGDAGCISLLADLGHWLGVGTASLAAVLDPEVIVVGGGVSAAGELLLQPARDSFATHVTARLHRQMPRFVLASTGNDAGMIGAADLARTPA